MNAKQAIIIAALVAGCGLLYGQMFAQRFGATSTARLPAEYQEVEYLESSGTQYIDTTILFNLATAGVTIDCMGLAANNRMWGVTENIDGTTRRISEYFTSFGVAYVSLNVGVSLGHAISNRAVVAISGGEISLDGVKKGTYANGDIQFTRSFRLFGEIQGVGAGTMTFGKSRVYSARLHVSAESVRDFVPARRVSDNVLGMYDLVSKVFFTNAGTGSFTAGPDIE